MKAASAVLVGLVVLGATAHASAADKGEKGGKKRVETRVFELRTYHAAPGKMGALHARFREHTNGLFKKHGMEIIGFWVPADPKKADRTLVYLLAFPSKEAARKSWEAFRADPEWKKVKEESEKGGALVTKIESVFLTPTDYSPMK
jgi:hypothetical protein